MRRKMCIRATQRGDVCRKNCGGAIGSCQDQGNEESPGATSADKAVAEGRAPQKPSRRTRINTIDLESRILKGADGIVQGYNAQAAVEPTWLLIVGQSVMEQPMTNSN